MSAHRSMVDCHDCSQASIAVTRARGDLATVARKATRQLDPSPALLAEIAAAKAEVKQRADWFAEHLALEHST